VECVCVCESAWGLIWVASKDLTAAPYLNLPPVPTPSTLIHHPVRVGCVRGTRMARPVAHRLDRHCTRRMWFCDLRGAGASPQRPSMIILCGGQGHERRRGDGGGWRLPRLVLTRAVLPPAARIRTANHPPTTPAFALFSRSTQHSSTCSRAPPSNPIQLITPDGLPGGSAGLARSVEKVPGAGG